MGQRENGKKKNRREGRGERERERSPTPGPLDHFTLTQFLLGPSSRGQTLPVGASLKAIDRTDSNDGG